MDCEKHGAFCGKVGIQSYPTLRLYWDSKDFEESFHETAIHAKMFTDSDTGKELYVKDATEEQKKRGDVTR